MSNPPTTSPPVTRREESPDFRWFGAAIASWFGCFGMQSTLFSWLLVGELGASDEWVGIAQTANMLPSIVLLLVGGAAADRLEPRRVLIALHAIGTLPILALSAAVAFGHLTIPIVMSFGISMGVISAFSMPARDILLSRVAGNDMMRAVTTMTAVQFGAQALGALTAGIARWVGSAPTLVLQALVLLAGSLVTHRIPDPAPAAPPPLGKSALHDIADGVKQVVREPRLWSPLLLVFAVGFLFVGPFLVTFPIIVTHVYGGTIAELSIVMMLFPSGTIAGSLALRRWPIRRKGLASLLALLFGAANLAVVGLGLPFPVMVLATMAWGLAGSVFINCSRTLYQEAAPPTQRGRVLAIYQLGFMGAAPLGAMTAGFTSGQIGPLSTLFIFASGMVALVVAAAALTDLRQME